MTKQRLTMTLATEPRARALLQLLVDEGAGWTEHWCGDVPSEDLGLPTFARGDPLSDSQFSLPAALGTELATVLRPSSPTEPLWVQLVEPFGYLGLVPWEQLLAPFVRGPVLRLPTIRLERREPGHTLHVAVLAPVSNAERPGPVRERLHGVRLAFDAWGSTIVASTTRGAATSWRQPTAERSLADDVDALVHAVVVGSPRPTTVHVLTTSWARRDLQARWRVEGPRSGSVILHDAGELARAADRRPADGPVQPSAWLRMLAACLGGEQADVVHLMCHAYLSGSAIRLTFADPPERLRTGSGSRYTSLQALQAMLTAVGAWSVALSSPSQSPTTPQLRLAACELAEYRPGPVLFTDMDSDPYGHDIERGYAFLYAREPVPAPALLGGMVASEPHRVLDCVDREAVPTPARTQEPVIAEVLRGDHTPTWLAAAQRFLEQRQADLTRLQRDAPIGSASPQGQQVIAGVQDAMRAIQTLMADHTKPGQDKL